ncbi:phenylpyruvate tautomerase MIF-related protein [Thioalkalivibrio sulfidiphilus]|uniref:phenylpyruvate tautomerase MIF-related protein n=1 Tax=Thioalkalivibrio sulfidiphilus TaxID=1033854 RepID=UPI00036613BB|nr:phenylpyruvate tautomerase MIF-related protein [Thioalkalivibrio sulfidiphilus]
MPLLSIETNQRADDASIAQLLKLTSRALAEQLGKPERYVMVRFQHNPDMLFAGEDTPLAYLEMKSIGLSESETGDLSALLCRLVEEELKVPRDRIYIEFASAPRKLWGWNGGTF